ncbi:MAG: DEAD/DEAH box helicase [Balneolales bacterium]
MSFTNFKLNEKVEMGLKDVGFEKPTPIQEKCIPLILEGHDVLASAQTGTGKTAAFVLPILNHIIKNKEAGIQALILTPTRELAQQIDEQFFSLGYHTGLSTVTVYGGSGGYSQQEKAMKKGVNIVVATPGRLLDHIKTGSVDFSNLSFLVLDEADRMLDMGFIPDVQRIIKELPKKRQNLMFSATMPTKIDLLVNKIMTNPKRINIASLKPAVGIKQVAYELTEETKIPLLLDLFDKSEWNSTIVFTATKRLADKLARKLSQKGTSVTSIHGDRSQKEREEALAQFKSGKYKVIVATDVMSRGIDVDNVSHVINFSVPHDVEDYVHRIGRTARAETTGDAITLVSKEDKQYMKNIFKSLNQPIEVLSLPVKIAEMQSEVGEGQASRSRSGGRNKNNSSERKPSGRKPGRKTAEAKSVGSKSPSAERKKVEQTPATRNKRSSPNAESGSRRKKQNSRNQGSRKSPVNGRGSQESSSNGSNKSRKDLLDKVQSPNTKKLDKTLNAKKGLWSKFKENLFG